SYAFVSTRLVNVTLPEGLIKLGDHAFSSKVTGATLNDASKLQTIVLPSTLTEIDEYTFYFCEDLTTVTYGANLAKVWSNAFNYCSKITTFNTAGNTGISLVATVGANTFANCNLEASDLTNVGDNNVNEVLGK
ncbi:MAG: leucine-rich repeat domain-containing protein, partial [Clostridia bacterium]|nr:leucine-rich repeat domain-containing protein [Clostridia bacterium]